MSKRREIALQNFSTRKTLWKIAETIFEGHVSRIHRSFHVERLVDLGLITLSPTESRRMHRADMKEAGWAYAPPKLRAFHALNPRNVPLFWTGGPGQPVTVTILGQTSTWRWTTFP